MAPKYKLTYFNLRGIAEPVRYMFAYKDVQYEDIRVEQEKWPHLKSKQPFGKLPVLEVEGKIISESLAVTRFISRELGLDGKNHYESAVIDMIIDATQDCIEGIRTFARREKNEERKECLKQQFFAETIPVCFRGLEKVLEANGGKVFVGDNLTRADFGIASFVELIRDFKAEAVAEYPLLESHLEQINSIPQIKEWREKRPKTDL